MKIFNVYRSYLPAFLSFAGAVIIAVGLFLSSSSPSSVIAQNLRFFGAVFAAIGALWSVHRQVISSFENKELTKRILDLSEQIQGQVTGGDSFCYAYPYFGSTTSKEFTWTFIHVGKHPITDVSVRICNLNSPRNLDPFLSDVNLTLGTLFPGRAHTTTYVQQNGQSGAFNLFFIGKNGGWIQEIRWTRTTEFAVANRVRRDGEKLENPAYYDVTANYPNSLTKEGDWNGIGY